MSLRELQVNTLQGSVFTLDVSGIETVQQLKWMLREHFLSDDPIDQKILKVYRSCATVAYYTMLRH